MVNPNKVGFVFGALLGGVHLVWSLLVLTGLAQALLDFIMWAHMLHMPVIVGPFDAVAFVTLIVVTSAIGFAVGNVGARVWMRVHQS